MGVSMCLIETLTQTEREREREGYRERERKTETESESMTGMDRLRLDEWRGKRKDEREKRGIMGDEEDNQTSSSTFQMRGEHTPLHHHAITRRRGREREREREKERELFSVKVCVFIC